MLEIMRDKSEGTGRAPLVFLAGLLLCGAGAAGCAPDATADEPPTGQSAALFRDPNTSGPRLDVYDFDGHPVISVSGPIGTERILDGLTGDESLVEIYRTLHPERSAPPADLIALDRRVAPELAAIRAATPPLSEDDRPAVFDKSQTDFILQACQNFRVSSYTIFKPQECPWTPDAKSGYLRVGNRPNKIAAGDRVYGWNNTIYRAILDISGLDTGKGPVAETTLDAHHWGFITAPIAGGPFMGSMVTIMSTANQGDAGLTWHRRFNIVH